MEKQRSLHKGLQTGRPFQLLTFKDDVKLCAFQVLITVDSKSQVARGFTRCRVTSMKVCR
jgi:hypothetical protein